MPSLEEICVNDLRTSLGLPSKNVRALSDSNYSSAGSLRFIRFSESIREGIESGGLSKSLFETFFGVLPVVLTAAAREEGWNTSVPQTLRDLDRYLELVPTDFPHSMLQAHRVAMKLVEKQLLRQLELRSPFLELGLGDGHASKFLFEGTPISVGGEARLFSLNMAKRFDAHEKLAAIDMQQIPFADASFSCVSVIQALNRVSNREKALSEMARVLKPGGTLLITDASEHFSSMHSLYGLLGKLGFGSVAQSFSEMYWNYSGQNPNQGAEPHFYQSTLELLGFDKFDIQYFMSEELTLISYLYFPFICLLFRQSWPEINSALVDPQNRPLRDRFIQFLRETIVPLVDMDRAFCRRAGKGSELIIVAHKRGEIENGMRGSIFDELICPECFRELASEKQGYRCRGCNLFYPIVDGLPLLIPFYAREYEASSRERKM